MRSTTKKGFVIPKKAFAVLLGMELFKNVGREELQALEGFVDGFFVQNSGFGSEKFNT